MSQVFALVGQSIKYFNFDVVMNVIVLISFLVGYIDCIFIVLLHWLDAPVQHGIQADILALYPVSGGKQCLLSLILSMMLVVDFM